MRRCLTRSSDQRQWPINALNPWAPTCKDSGDQPLDQVLKESQQAPDLEKERRLYCIACKHSITSHGQRAEVQGAHQHTCANPRQINYHIGCFRQAPGCIEIGETTEEYTWFAGYAWQVALCGGCGTHLGWLFQRRGADRFYGLILAQLAGEH